MQNVFNAREGADDLQTNEIIRAVMRRYARVYPEWDVMFFSVHKEPELRKEDVDGIIRLLKKTACAE